MYNAIIPDEHLHGMGVFKERLSQAGLYAEMRDTADSEARAVYDWLRARSMRFTLGKDPAVDLTEAQVLEQCKMYIAALRISNDFGCDVIGIQYQQGLKDLTVASDLAEGLLNNVDRPPVKGRDGKLLYAGRATASFQRSGRVCGTRCTGHEPDLAAARACARDHASRCALWRVLRNGSSSPVCLDAANFRRASSCTSRGWLCRSGERTAAAHVLSPGRRNHQGH